VFNANGFLPATLKMALLATLGEGAPVLCCGQKKSYWQAAGLYLLKRPVIAKILFVVVFFCVWYI